MLMTRKSECENYEIARIGKCEIGETIKVANAPPLLSLAMNQPRASFTSSPAQLAKLLSDCLIPVSIYSNQKHYIIISTVQYPSKNLFYKYLYCKTRSLGVLRALTSCWRPIGPLNFVLCELWELRPCDSRL